MKTFFKWTAWAFGIVLLFAALAAAGIVSLGQYLPDGATLHMGDEILTLGEGASLGVSHGLFVWLMVTFALVISFFAVVFAFSVAGLALFGVGLLLISPVLSVVLVVWLIARAVTKRKSNHSSIGVPSSSNLGNA
jgi:hypothetical protein